MTHTPRDMRNKVAALLTEKAKPDLDTIAVASLIADATIRSRPDQPWGYLARNDLARHLGRADLLVASREKLETFAAQERLVRVALDDGTGRASLWVWLLRILVLLGLTATVVHARRHRRRGGGTPNAAPVDATAASRPAVVLVIVLSLLVPSRAVADTRDMPVLRDKEDQISRFKIDDAHPDDAVKTLFKETKDPLQLGYLLQDLSARADQAHKAGDHARAARYYHALGVAAPTAFGPRMECDALEKLGDIPNAIRPCREVLTRVGVIVDDYVHFVELVLKNPNQLPDLEPKELEGVIAHLEKEGKTGNLPTVLRCNVAMRFEEQAGLDKCTAAMSTAPADDPTVISIKWGLAMRRHDSAGALLLVERGRKIGMSADALARMEQATNAITAQRSQKAKVLGGLGVFVVVAAFLGVRLLSASRRRATSQSAA